MNLASRIAAKAAPALFCCCIPIFCARYWGAGALRQLPKRRRRPPPSPTSFRTRCSRSIVSRHGEVAADNRGRKQKPPPALRGPAGAFGWMLRGGGKSWVHPPVSLQGPAHPIQSPLCGFSKSKNCAAQVPLFRHCRAATAYSRTPSSISRGLDGSRKPASCNQVHGQDQGVRLCARLHANRSRRASASRRRIFVTRCSWSYGVRTESVGAVSATSRSSGGLCVCGPAKDQMV
jgi:hypothetical protein